VSRPALLDVNVLVALFDPDHIHHEAAHDWFADYHSAGWATCPVTENGFFRVLSNPAYGAAVTRPVDLADRLRRFCASPQHRFWDDSISFRDGQLFDHAFVGGHRQVIDVYLLALAVKKGGCLATFDRTIPLKAVKGATRPRLLVIGPAPDD
jgi:toxin-antitoxin system PIN domain toxin